MTGEAERRAAAPARGAVATMLAGDRILELPTAAVYLAEAEWRAATRTRADRAADLALRGRAAPGLQPPPPAGARRLPRGGRAPHRRRARGALALARPRAARCWPRAWRVDPRVRGARRARGVRRAGDPAVNGATRRARASPRATSCWPTWLAARSQWPRATTCSTALFDGRSDASARAYLRQAIHRLRESLPDGVELTSELRGRATGATACACPQRVRRAWRRSWPRRRACRARSACGPPLDALELAGARRVPARRAARPGPQERREQLDASWPRTRASRPRSWPSLPAATRTPSGWSRRSSTSTPSARRRGAYRCASRAR